MTNETSPDPAEFLAAMDLGDDVSVCSEEWLASEMNHAYRVIAADRVTDYLGPQALGTGTPWRQWPPRLLARVIVDTIASVAPVQRWPKPFADSIDVVEEFLRASMATSRSDLSGVRAKWTRRWGMVAT